MNSVVCLKAQGEQSTDLAESNKNVEKDEEGLLRNFVLHVLDSLHC